MKLNEFANAVGLTAAVKAGDITLAEAERRIPLAPRVTGVDGKQYPAKVPAQRRTNLPAPQVEAQSDATRWEQFAEAEHEYGRRYRQEWDERHKSRGRGKKFDEPVAVFGRGVDQIVVTAEVFMNILEKAPWQQHREQLADEHYNRIRRVRDYLTDLLDELGGES